MAKRKEQNSAGTSTANSSMESPQETLQAPSYADLKSTIDGKRAELQSQLFNALYTVDELDNQVLLYRKEINKLKAQLSVLSVE